ncbi:MAG: RagB/SusD family nutrient uptake outer membrane protein [Prevotellaceae bacterium]|jgi:hypothetical protein|nr:RagB/SusD family nutrient uptake outer membrane protein [Prevotellaceae bacterium]
MKMTKAKITIIAGAATLLVAMVGAASCSDFLEKESLTTLTEEQAYENLETVESLVVGLYRLYAADVRSGGNGMRTLLGTDECQLGQDQYLASSDRSVPGFSSHDGLLPTSTTIAGLWQCKWLVITPAAKAIYLLPKFAGEDPDKVKILLGEAHFFRGMVMLEQTVNWGKIPIIDLNSNLNGGRQPLAEVWKYIINDFKAAAERLPETNTDDRKRATRYAALAMLGKAYMAAPEETELRSFESAKECFDQIIGKYSLVNNYATLFANDHTDTYGQNTVESIFELQYNNTDQPNRYQWEFGSRAVTEIQINGTAIGGRCYFGGYDMEIPTDYMHKSVDSGGVWEKGDQRMLLNIRYDLTYQGVQPTPASWGGSLDELGPHVRKFEDYRTEVTNNVTGAASRDTWDAGKNFPLIRYADILLLQAECLNELGETSSGVALVNEVRRRAWGGTLPDDMKWSSSMSKDEFLEKIMDERMRELCFETWRRMDLIRTGQYIRRVSKYNRWANERWGDAGFPENRILWPIPQDEINTNEDFASDPNAQNPGYPK